MKFFESMVVLKYVYVVKLLSINIGFSVGGFVGFFVGEVYGSYVFSFES